MSIYTTRRATLGAIGAIIAGSAVGGSAAGQGPRRNFSAHLTGAAHGLDRDDTLARGQAQFQAVDDGLRFKLIVANIEDVTMGHIHLGHVLGPIAVWLHEFDDGVPSLIRGHVNGVLAEGTITDNHVSREGELETVAELIAEIDADNAFVNVHTEDFPGGEIGGQIHARN